MRFLFYSHDGVGLGHVRRHLAIASALVEMAPQAKILLATSVDEVSRLGLPPNVDTLKLPGLRKVSNNQYTSRRLGLRALEIRALRSALLEAAVGSFQPRIILVDKHPFGAGGEFRSALESAKAAGTVIALGLRDILDGPDAVRNEWTADGVENQIGEFFESVLVYGSPEVFDPIQEYELPDTVAERVQYCGYVVNPESISGAPSGAAEPETRVLPAVLCTAGGGEDGFELLREFMLSAHRAPWQGIAIAGPMMSNEELKLLRPLAAQTQVPLHKFIPSLARLFTAADCLVTMGGYNTLAEAAACGIPTICVPRIVPRTEQLIRARAFEKLGLLRVVDPRELNRERLRTEIETALATSRQELLRRARASLNFDGARCAAQRLLDLTRVVSNPESASPKRRSKVGVDI